MSEHTQGAWDFDPVTSNVLGPDSIAIARVRHLHNGPVVAAAPTLLEALRECEKAMAAAINGKPVHMGPALTAARAAITAAAGCAS